MKVTNTGKLLILLDVGIIFLSLSFAWLIRSQFAYFLYGLSKFIFLFPWVLFSRLVFHFFFGLYTFSLVSLTNRDITRIFKYNSVPSIILLILRFVPFENELIRMPLSMIAIEYIFSTVGFLLIRLYLHSSIISKDSPSGYKRRLILWGEIRDIQDNLDLAILNKNQNVEIVAILNANPLYWNTEYNSIRVYGNESEIDLISAADERISGIVFLENCELTKRQRNAIMHSIEKLHMDIAYISNNICKIASSDWLASK